MGQVIELSVGNWKLELRVGNDDWCECVLVDKTQIHNLGRENLSYITKQLFVALSGTKKQETNDNKSYSWVLSLGEIHSSLYLARGGDTTFLLWQDANAKTLAEISLSLAECLTLCNQLRQIMESKRESKGPGSNCSVQ